MRSQVTPVPCAINSDGQRGGFWKQWHLQDGWCDERHSRRSWERERPTVTSMVASMMTVTSTVTSTVISTVTPTVISTMGPHVGNNRSSRLGISRSRDNRCMSPWPRQLHHHPHQDLVGCSSAAVASARSIAQRRSNAGDAQRVAMGAIAWRTPPMLLGVTELTPEVTGAK